MIESCEIEIFIDGVWIKAGVITLRGLKRDGVNASACFEYLPEYLDQMFDRLEDKSFWAVSCRYPISYALYEEQHWPAFLLDIMPSGAARRGLEAALQLNNTPSSDWELLTKGGGNPPGHLRIAGAIGTDSTESKHPGFSYQDIIDRREEFMVYASAAGAPISGSSGAGGDAPKFLLREDYPKKWHADGVLPDIDTKRHMLVKFPRGSRTSIDCTILKAEKSYYDVAKSFGAKTHRPLLWDNDCLFIERFDRISTNKGLIRLGQESLCAIAGVASFGAQIPLEDMVQLIHDHSSAPEADIKEFVLRDILNVAMGNTDNHPRNTAMTKFPDGQIRLAPLFDFAPMFLDPSGIYRGCKWSSEVGVGYPVWTKVAETLQSRNLVNGNFKKWLKSQAVKVENLPKLMKQFDTPEEVTSRCIEKVVIVARMLNDIK